jgi:hypothetical protein
MLPTTTAVLGPSTAANSPAPTGEFSAAGATMVLQTSARTTTFMKKPTSTSRWADRRPNSSA